MFCEKCGTKLGENAKFCQNCGARTGEEGRTTVSYGSVPTNESSVWFLAMIAITVFVAIGAFLPTMSIYFYIGEKVFSTIDVMDFFDFVDTYTDVSLGEMGFGFICMMASVVAFGGSLISGLGFGVALLKGDRGIGLSSKSKTTAVFGAVAVVCIGAFALLANFDIDDDIFSLTTQGWALLIASLANIFYVIPQYEGVQVARDVKRIIPQEKECMVCGAKYSVGNVCPNCGAKAMDM